MEDTGTENSLNVNRRQLVLSIAITAGLGGCASQDAEEPTPTDPSPTPEETVIPTETAQPGPTPTPENTPTPGETVSALDYDATAPTDRYLLPGDAFPQGWNRADAEYEEFDVVYFNEGRTIAVPLGATVFETVDEAERAYEAAESRYRDPTPLNLGDAAFQATRESYAITVFRDANAVGIVAGSRSGSESTFEPAVERAQQYAAEMLDRWQDL